MPAHGYIPRNSDSKGSVKRQHVDAFPLHEARGPPDTQLGERVKGLIPHQLDNINNLSAMQFFLFFYKKKILKKREGERERERFL